MTRVTGIAIRAAPTTEAAEANPLNFSDERSDASRAPTAAPAATPTPPNIWARASTVKMRFWVMGGDCVTFCTLGSYQQGRGAIGPEVSYGATDECQSSHVPAQP